MSDGKALVAPMADVERFWLDAATRRADDEDAQKQREWLRWAEHTGPTFRARAEESDAHGAFVRSNYLDLEARRAFSAGVPSALGGGGLSYRGVCHLLRTIAHYCSSTALAFSMHSQQVAFLGRRWQSGQRDVEPLLRRVADEQMAIVTSGGSDWLNGSGRAQRVEGGYQVSARKLFASGCPAGNLLITTAVWEDAPNGAEVLHFPVELNVPGVRILNNWDTLVMRGTGSNDVVLEGVFVPEQAVIVRRTPGKWHPVLQSAYVISFPMILSAYVGVAEAARSMALQEVQKKRTNQHVQLLAGQMETELRKAQIMLADAIELACEFEIGHASTNEMMIRKSLIAQACMATVDKALEVVGGGSFYRAKGLERLFRDVQAVRFHPLQDTPRHQFTGQIALGVDPDASDQPAAG